MDRRQFLGTSAGAALAAFSTPASAAAAPTATVLYGSRATKLDKIRPDAKDLWVRAADLPRINEFTLKPQGACREDICIPVPKDLKQGEWLNLTGFAHRTGEAVVAESNVWSFGEIPLMGQAFRNTRVAPDFAVPDRQGRVVRLSSFRGKKVLVITWASW